MSFIDEIKQRAKNDLKTIVLPEATDIRVLQQQKIYLKSNLQMLYWLEKKIQY